MDILIFNIVALGFSYIGHDETADSIRFRFVGMAVVYAIIQAIASIGGY